MLTVATNAARTAGEILLGYYGRASLEVEEKAPADLVSEADLASERAIRDSIAEAFPEHGFLLEETGRVDRESDYVWLVDPLDGTANFVHRFPVFCISIALSHKGEVVLGVVYDPLRNEMFTAERGDGARLNGVEVGVSRVPSLDRALVATGFPFRNRHHLDGYLALFRDVFEGAADLRRAGAAALDLAWTACGRLDGFFELGLSPWDVAAGSLLVGEAGGLVSDFHAGQGHMEAGDIVAGNGPGVHAALVARARRAFPRERPRRA